MALDTTDLQQIRDIVFEGMQATVDAVNPRFEALEQGQDELKAAQRETNQRLDKLETGQRNLETGQRETNQRLTALEQRFDTFEGKLAAIVNDIKELYDMIQAAPEIKNKADFKQYAESVILDTHKRLQALAKEADVSLPS